MIVPLPPASAAALVDAHHGWVGTSSALFATEDGRHFRLGVRAPIVGISAVDARHAWALTGDGFVLRTQDGSRWSRLGAPHLFAVKFLDSRNGFGVTRDGVVVKSSDAGRSWPQVQTPGTMQTECFSTVRDGWTARGSSVWTTHDAGVRWHRTVLRKGRLDGTVLPHLECAGASVWLLLAGGAAAGSQGYLAFRSLNGGATWRAVLGGVNSVNLPKISAYSGPFAALGGGSAVFEGSCAACRGSATVSVVRTRDGGRTFARVTPFSSYFPGPLAFADPAHGWVLLDRASGGSVLFETSDGGGLWHPVATFRRAPA